MVHQLSATDFNLTESATSTISFLAFDTTGAFDVSAVTGEVTVKAPQNLADDSVYFQWVVCRIGEADGSMKSEMVMLRVDTLDKYKHVVALLIALEVSELEEQRLAVFSLIMIELMHFYRMYNFVYLLLCLFI